MTRAFPHSPRRGSEREDTVLALVDFNNVDPAARDSDARIVDALELVGVLVRQVLAVGPMRSRDARDVELRLYDGWVDKNGATMDKQRRTSRLFPTVLSGLRDGVRIRVEVVTTLACAPDRLLAGTYINGAQKMVDQMLAQDLHYFAALETYRRICLIANDEDYVPAAIAVATRYTTPITWLRARPTGRNDLHLKQCRVATLHDSNWRR